MWSFIVYCWNAICWVVGGFFGLIWKLAIWFIESAWQVLCKLIEFLVIQYAVTVRLVFMSYPKSTIGFCLLGVVAYVVWDKIEKRKMMSLMPQPVRVILIACLIPFLAVLSGAAQDGGDTYEQNVTIHGSNAGDISNVKKEKDKEDGGSFGKGVVVALIGAGGAVGAAFVGIKRAKKRRSSE